MSSKKSARKKVATSSTPTPTPTEPVTLDQLVAQTNTHCDYRHNSCRQLNKLLERFHAQGDRVNDLFMVQVLDNLILRSGCLHYLAQFIAIFDYYTPTPLIWKKLLSCNCLTVVNKLVARGVTFSRELIHELLTYKSPRQYYYVNRTQVDLIIETMLLATPGLTNQTLQYCLTKNYLKSAKAVLNQGVKGNITTLRLACKSSHTLVDTLLDQGVQPDLTCLESICETGKCEQIKKLLNYRITPNKNCITSILGAGPVHYTRGRKRTYRYSYGGRLTEEQINTLLDMMVADGYKVTFADVATSLAKRVKLYNLYQYGIPLDSKLLAECHKHDYYPYDIQVTQDLNCLRELCRKPNGLVEVKKLVKAGVIPDHICLEKAVEGNNATTVKFILTHVSPRVKVLESSMLAQSDGIFKMLAPQLTQTYTQMEEEAQQFKTQKEEYEEKIAQLESQLDQLRASPSVKEVDPPEEQVPDYTPEDLQALEAQLDSEEFQEKKKKKKKKKSSSEEEPKKAKKSKKSRKGKKSKKSKKGKKRKSSKIRVKKKKLPVQQQLIEEENDSDLVPTNGAWLDFSELTQKLPEDIKSKKPLGAEVCQQLKLSGDPHSYLEVKEALLDRIMAEEMFQEKDENKIQLTPSLRKLAQLQKGLLKFQDLDQVVVRLYQA